MSTALADREETPQQLLRDLDAGEDLVVLLGIAEDDDEREREVGDVRERPPTADHERGEDGEDLALEQLVELLALLRRRLLGSQDPDPVLGERRAQLPFDGRTGTRALDQDPLAYGGQDLGRGHPVSRAGLGAGLDHVLEVGDPDHELLVEVRLPDRRELDPLEQRHRRVLGQLQDAVVEVEPGELAVEVEGRVLEVRLTVARGGRGLLVDSRRLRDLGLGRLHCVRQTG